METITGQNNSPQRHRETYTTLWSPMRMKMVPGSGPFPYHTEDENLVRARRPKPLCISTVSSISDFSQVFDDNTKISLCLCVSVVNTYWPLTRHEFVKA